MKRQNQDSTSLEEPVPRTIERREEEQSDAIIGIALRRSVVFIVCVAALAFLFWLLLWDREADIPVEEAQLKPPASLPASKLPEPPSLPFKDVTRTAGIDFVHQNGAAGERLLPETMGGGVAFADLDADGDPDLLFVNSIPWPWSSGASRSATSELYINNGDGNFADVTRGSGLDVSMYGMGVALGDADGDGLVDVFVTAVGPNRLFRNLGDGRFEDISVQAGVAGADNRWSTSAAFLDYDGDRDLDLFVANYVQWSRELDFEVDYRLAGIGRAYGPPNNFAGTQPYLYRNDGEGRFTDVSAEAGVHVTHANTGEAVGKGLAVVIEDIDADGWQDIVVANDTVRNFFFRNLGGRFQEQGVDRGLAYDNSGHATGAMGIDVVRHPETGEMAIVIGNFANEMTSYYVDPSGTGLFTDEAIISGIGPASRSVLSFGLFFFDADLDGRQDLLQANGHVEDDINIVQASQQHAQSPQIFWNCGLDCPRRFVLVPPSETGDLYMPMVGRGAAYADMDGDGDLDVVLTEAGGRARVFRNDQATGHHWLRVRLQGRSPNALGIGARIRLLHAGGADERRVGSARSYLSQTELVSTFGLGNSDASVNLEVVWPDGVSQLVEGVSVDQEITIRRR